VVSTPDKASRASLARAGSSRGARRAVGSGDVRAVGGSSRPSFVPKRFVPRSLCGKGDLQQGGVSGRRQHSAQSLTSVRPPWNRVRPSARILL
jgi:hypothetical protein